MPSLNMRSGNAETSRDAATDIDIHAREVLRARDTTNAVLARHTGQSLERIRADTVRDYYLSAEGGEGLRGDRRGARATHPHLGNLCQHSVGPGVGRVTHDGGPVMIPAPVVTPYENLSSGGRLVSVDGVALPLAGARLKVSAGGGVAEVVLEQRFRNPHQVPLAVTYDFGLPADAAVSG